MDRRRYAFFMLLILILAAAMVVIYAVREEGDAGAGKVGLDDYDPTWDIEIVVRLDRIRKLDFTYGEEPTYWVEITVDGQTVKNIGPYAGLEAYPR